MKLKYKVDDADMILNVIYKIIFELGFWIYGL